jgi:long-chain acyl-CoA synthetase
VAQRFENLVQTYRESCESYADRNVFAQKTEGGWQWMTYRELDRRVDEARAGLAELGVGAGDRVAIIADNRVDWAVSCYASYGLCATFVPMYEAQRPEEWRFILEDSGAKVVLVASSTAHGRLAAMQDELASLEHVIGLDLPSDHPHGFDALLARQRDRRVPPRLPDPEAVAGFIYTSGTTGRPKGVIASHRNLTSNLNAIREVFPLDPGERTLSFLPWAHSFGQVCELHYGLSSGCEIAINDEIPHLVDNLAQVRPTMLVAVPRIFNRIYDGVRAQISEKPAVLQTLFWNGIDAATRRARGQRIGLVRGLELKLDDKLMFSKIRDKFGGRLKFVISGSAALNQDVAQFIDALGIVVYEGYGLSETSPVVSANYPGSRKLGSVGKPLPGVRVVIDTAVTGDTKEGEIVVYGPNVTRGYHNRPDENAELFTEDGGLRTGDLGHLDDEGYLHVTGRIKEQYKLENGRYVMPAPLEEELQLSPYIANVMLHGANRPYNVALVVPDRAALTSWAREHGHELGPIAEDPKVHDLLRKEIAEHTKHFKRYEIPKKFVVAHEEFTPKNGMLTPTLKVKRRNAYEAYAEPLEHLYAEDRQRRAV